MFDVRKKAVRERVTRCRPAGRKKDSSAVRGSRSELRLLTETLLLIWSYVVILTTRAGVKSRPTTLTRSILFAKAIIHTVFKIQNLQAARDVQVLPNRD